MQSQRDAGFLDFLKKRAPAPPRSNPLSKLIDPDVVENYLKSKTHMNITGVTVEPLGFGVSLTVTAYEEMPLNRTRSLEGAMDPMVSVIEDYLHAPVDVHVSLDMDNPLFDPNDGLMIYKILLKADRPLEMVRNASARRVATRVMLLDLLAGVTPETE